MAKFFLLLQPGAIYEMPDGTHVEVSTKLSTVILHLLDQCSGAPIYDGLEGKATFALKRALDSRQLLEKAGPPSNLLSRQVIAKTDLYRLLNDDPEEAIEWLRESEVEPSQIVARLRFWVDYCNQDYGDKARRERRVKKRVDNYRSTISREDRLDMASNLVARLSRQVNVMFRRLPFEVASEQSCRWRHDFAFNLSAKFPPSEFPSVRIPRIWRETFCEVTYHTEVVETLSPEERTQRNREFWSKLRRERRIVELRAALELAGEKTRASFEYAIASAIVELDRGANRLSLHYISQARRTHPQWRDNAVKTVSVVHTWARGMYLRALQNRTRDRRVRISRIHKIVESYSMRGTEDSRPLLCLLASNLACIGIYMNESIGEQDRTVHLTRIIGEFRSLGATVSDEWQSGCLSVGAELLSRGLPVHDLESLIEIFKNLSNRAKELEFPYVNGLSALVEFGFWSGNCKVAQELSIQYCNKWHERTSATLQCALAMICLIPTRLEREESEKFVVQLLGTEPCIRLIHKSISLRRLATETGQDKFFFALLDVAENSKPFDYLWKFPEDWERLRT